jgi:uncharacterized protein (TIGR02996 family)
MNDDRAFIRAIMARPDDDTLRQVYADWLEERGDPRGEFLRLEALVAQSKDPQQVLAARERLQTLRKEMAPDWLAQLARSKIELCEQEFRFPCPKQWAKLRPTDEAGVRYCEGCAQNVYYCHSLAEARAHAWQFHCVAVDAGVERTEGDIERPVFMGLLAMPEDATQLRPHRATQLRASRRTRHRRAD